MKKISNILSLLFAVALPAPSWSQQSPPGPFDWVELDQQPAPLNMVEYRRSIAYPDSAFRAEITGKVILRVLVDTLGNVVEHLVMKDPHPLLTAATVKALPVLRFSPGMLKGRKVSAWHTLPPISFQNISGWGYPSKDNKRQGLHSR